VRSEWRQRRDINPLNAELNPICHLLALLGAHHILHVSSVRVKETLDTNTNEIVYSEGCLTQDMAIRNSHN